MMRYIFLITLLVTFSSTSVWAVESSKHNRIWLGGMGGWEKVDKTNFTLYGGTLGVRFAKYFGVAGFYLTSNKKSGGVAGISTEIQHTMYGGEPMFMFGNDRIIGNIGVKLGASEAKGSATVGSISVSASSSDFMAGPAFGLDIKIVPVLSIGAEGGYNRVFATTGYNVITALGALKFWF